MASCIRGIPVESLTVEQACMEYVMILRESVVGAGGVLPELVGRYRAIGDRLATLSRIYPIYLSFALDDLGYTLCIAPNATDWTGIALVLPKHACTLEFTIQNVSR